MNTLAKDTARMEMWESLIPNYMFLSTVEKKRAKRKYAKEKNLLPHEINPATENLTATEVRSRLETLKVCVDDVNPPILDYPGRRSLVSAIQQMQQEKEEKMLNITNSSISATAAAAPPIELVQKDYLKRRASDINWSFRDNLLPKKYKIVDDAPPKTAKELFTRLTEGKFVVTGYNPEEPEKDKDLDWYSPPSAYIQWRSEPADKEGFSKAKEELKKLYTETQDIIMTGDAKEGLEAVQKLEAFEG